MRTGNRRSSPLTRLGGRDGMMLLAVAAFVIPWVGSGAVAGLAGLALIDHWPSTQREWLVLAAMLGVTILPCVVLAVIVPVVLLGLRNARRRAWLLEHGERLEATVRSVEPMQRGRDAVYVRVDHPRGSAVEPLLLSPTLRNRIIVGNLVWIRVHPDDPTQIRIERE